MRRNPIYYNEKRAFLCNYRYAGYIVLFNFIVGFISLFVYYVCFFSTKEYITEYRSVLLIYLSIAVSEFVILIFVIPIITARSIAGEREKKTFDILLSTPLNPSQIIIGKLMYFLSFLMILFISSLPIICIVTAVGGVSITQIIQLAMVLLATLFYIGSFGMYCSTRMNRSVRAATCTYGYVLFSLLGTFALVIIIQILMYVSGMNLYSVYWVMFLFNPGYCLYQLLNHQTGIGYDFMTYMKYLEKCPDFLANHWCLISCVVQVSVGLLFLLLSVRRLSRNTEV